MGRHLLSWMKDINYCIHYEISFKYITKSEIIDYLDDARESDQEGLDHSIELLENELRERSKLNEILSK